MTAAKLDIILCHLLTLTFVFPYEICLSHLAGKKTDLREGELATGGNHTIKEVKFGFELCLPSNIVLWLIESVTLTWKGVLEII